MPDMFGKMQNAVSPAPRALGSLRVVSGVSLLLFAGFYLFFAMMIAYAGLFILLRSQQNARQEFVAQIEQKERDLRPELIDQIITLDKNIENLKNLLAYHTYTSQLFPLIEKTAHPRVRFTGFSFSLGGRKVEMNGDAPSYAVIAEQMRFFEANPQIERIDFGGLSLNQATGRVGFQASFIIDPRAIQKTL